MKTEDKKIEDNQSDDSVGVWKAAAFGSFALLLLFVLFDVDVKPKYSLDTEKKEVTDSQVTNSQQKLAEADFASAVAPQEGVTLPIVWGDFGKQMVDAGVIDAAKLESIYAQRGGLSEEDKQFLYWEENKNLKITPHNSGFVLNMLWAFGLSNKNAILEEGPMQDPKYGGADRFASTGGWSLAKDNAMDHYSKYSFAVLTQEQQELVERVSKNIYRPCCGNSTHFPDCNHGMAMLGLLEILASEGIGEEEMYKVALQVNSYWFPSTYQTLAKYFENKNVSWDEVNPKEVLGLAYSSGSGYQRILAQVEPVKQSGGGGCGV